MRKKGTISILFWLHKSKGTATEAPLVCRVTIAKQRYEIYLNYKVPLKIWVSEAQRCKTSTAFGKEINDAIDKLHGRIEAIVKKLTDEGEELTTQNIKIAIQGEEEQYHSVLSLFDYHKVVDKKNLTPSTMKLYDVTRNHIEKFIRIKYKVSDVDIRKVRKDFAAEFFAYLQGWKRDTTEPVCQNNAAIKHLQRITHLFNMAWENEWIENNPLAHFKTKTKQTDRGYLDMEEVKRIQELDTLSSTERIVRDIFIFSVYTGISYKDIEHLTQENLHIGIDGDKWIVFRRQKTANRCMIPLLRPAEDIISKYRTAVSYMEEETLLPVPTNQECNRYLKKIAKEAGINKRVTFHMARHTFATSIALTNNVPIETVQQMLGHANVTTTQIYAKVTGQKVSADTKALRELFAEKKLTNKAINE